jgi:hypothetical protein
MMAACRRSLPARKKERKKKNLKAINDELMAKRK